MAFALGAAFLLGDPARHTTAAAPVRRAVWHGLRLLCPAPVAAAAVRRGDGARPGQAVAGSLLAPAVPGPLPVPGSRALFVTPDDARWAVLLCAAVAVGAAEPVRRGIPRRLRSPSGTSGPSRT
ncbi:hypothetical protein AB0G55_27495 [Streptomyces toyocaensis]|uniref:hypothetical protein n=1 Tax=Streptomyces toyocaensis TaxID=55952 RepID=UPI000B205C22|nr:hypothetical protein [Streptomyces toyocaensis]